MQQEKFNNWSESLGFVQFMKNRALHPGIKRSFYTAIFGQPARIGLTSSILARDVIQNINTEEDLEKILEENTSVQQQINAEANSSENVTLDESSSENNILNQNLTHNNLFDRKYFTDESFAGGYFI